LSSLTGFVTALENAGDRSRILVADQLEVKYFRGIVDSGDIRAILVRNFGNTALSKEDHSALVGIVENGVSVGWSPEGDAYREMHRSGLWIKPEFEDRMEDLDLVVAMYGGNKDLVGDALQPQIDKFFDGLTAIVPAQNLAVAHGSGPGVMRVADETARSKNIMSLGVGISVEKIGQEENTRPDGVVRFATSDRLYRQQMLDTFNTISIFNAGGYGTLEEMAISVCTHKLLSCLPTPKIAIDPDGYYRNADRMISEVAQRTNIQAGGGTIDIAEHPFGDAWVPNTFHRVKDYDQALEIIKKFTNDPAAYWREAGIPAEKIQIAYASHQRRLAEVGMNIPTYMRRAAESYIQAA
jgi:predicted Rossmann-fold nucleotide-binding protein